MPQLRILFLGYCAIVVLLYWITPARWRSIFLALGSSVFLIYLDVSSFAALIAFTALIYYYGRQAEAKAFILYVSDSCSFFFVAFASCNYSIDPVMQSLF